MSVRFERREVLVAWQYIDPLGYLFCHDCTPAERRTELEFAASPQSESRCERCGRVVGEVRVKTNARVEVEYVQCRIF